MWVSIHVHEKRRGHEMWGLLCLLIKDKAIGISNQRSVVRVEENLVGKLYVDQEK